jgi:mannitol-1-phosphate 5-dehydrogenase
MRDHTFVGFGFGPIQSSLFAKEAFASGRFTRIVIAEVDQPLVDAVRSNGGRYTVNIAHVDRIEAVTVENVELLNPDVPEDRQTLVNTLCDATEIVTALPSVKFYDVGDLSSVVALISEGLRNSRSRATLIYTAENDNHAAEILEEEIRKEIEDLDNRPCQFLNTVIGKMSQVVVRPQEVKALNLPPIVPNMNKAILVEAFNRILVTKNRLPDFEPGIDIFVEKEDLLPFEEAKLYGHNAIHSLMAFMGAEKGFEKMSDLAQDESIMQTARDAFLLESGAALIQKYAALGDPLFTEQGYRDYVDDLMTRIINPNLSDAIVRVARDPVRKLAYADRIFGTMAVAMEYGIEPVNMAVGALAGVNLFLRDLTKTQLPEELHFMLGKSLTSDILEKMLLWIWRDNSGDYAPQIIKLLQKIHAETAAA